MRRAFGTSRKILHTCQHGVQVKRARAHTHTHAQSKQLLTPHDINTHLASTKSNSGWILKADCGQAKTTQSGWRLYRARLYIKGPVGTSMGSYLPRRNATQ